MRKSALLFITVISVSIQAQVYDNLDVYGWINGRKYINAEDSVTSVRLIGDTTETDVLLLGGREAISYDTLNKLGELNVFDENDETLLQVGYETWVPPSCYNGTASTILNGTPVYIDTTEQGYPSIAPADNRYYTESRIVGVATQDISAASYGTVTRFGLINGVPSMAGRESNNVFIGQNGGKVYTRPTGGKYPTKIGIALNDTTLLVFPRASEYTDEVVKAFGFPDYSNTYTTLSFDNSTRYFKISAVGSDFYHYQDGVKNINIADSVQISVTEGLTTIYYDNDTLKYLYGANDSELRDIYRNKVIVSRVYWDATNSQALHVGNQRHTFHIDPYQLEWENFAFGAMYASGMDVSNITTDGDGDFDTVAQFNIGSGGFYNEDIFITTPSISRGDNIPIYYWSGIPNVPRRLYEEGFPVLTDITAGVGSTGRLVYNNTTTGTLVTATNNYYVFCHLFALADVADSLKIISVVGESQYSNKTNAENAALVEGKQIAQGGIPGREGKLLYTFIYETSDGFANGVKARIVSTIDGDGVTVDYLDWRKSIIGSGGTGGGSTSFLDLTDSPSSYSGQAGKLVSVNSGETALEFIPNIYEDSAGIARIVDNSEFIDILIDTIETHQIRNIGTDDLTIRTNFSTGWIEQGTGLDNDYDFKAYYDNDYNEAFGFGLSYNVNASHVYLHTNKGEFDNINTVSRWLWGSYPYDTIAVIDSARMIVDTLTANNIEAGNADFTGKIEICWYEETYASSKTIDFTDGNCANRYITLTGGATVNVTLPYGTSTLEIVQDASGSHTVTIGTGWGTKWNTLDFDTGTNASTVVQFIKSPTGTKYFIGINQN